MRKLLSATAEQVCPQATVTAWSALDVGGIVTAAIALASALAAWIRAREKREIEAAYRERFERLLAERAIVRPMPPPIPPQARKTKPD